MKILIEEKIVLVGLRESQPESRNCKTKLSRGEEREY
jgi:hypothetical protein